MDINGYQYNGCLTEEQVKYILDNYDKMKNTDLFEAFGTCYSLPVKHLIKQCIRKDILKPKREVYKNDRNVRKEEIDKFVLDNYKNMTVEELAEGLNVTTVTIRTRIRQFKEQGVIGKEFFPVPDKIDYTDIYRAVRKDYDKKSAGQIAKDLGVEVRYVYAAASELIRRGQVRSKITRRGEAASDRFKSA